MKIIGGRLKGRALHMERGQSIRPTMAKVRECYFNIFQDLIPGAAFLDLCSGSGSMGIEAISRGARNVVFVEKAETSLSVLRENIERCGIGDSCAIIAGDVNQTIRVLGEKQRKFGLIYFDPPYFEKMYEKVLRNIDREGILEENGVLTANHFKKTPVPVRVGNLAIFREVRHGDSVLSMYKITPEEKS